MGAGSRRDPAQAVKYRLLVRRRAKTDVRSAARWYELQRPGLGREFVAEVDAALNRVAENPLRYQVLYRGVCRAIVHRFPYGVFYRIHPDRVEVIAVHHHRRDPSRWQSRA